MWTVHTNPFPSLIEERLSLYLMPQNSQSLNKL